MNMADSEQNNDKINVSASSTANVQNVARKKRFWLFVVSILLLTAALGYLYYRNYSDEYSFKYEKLASYTMPGVAKGTAITVDKPIDMANNAPAIIVPEAQYFVHLKGGGNDFKNGIPIAYLALQSRKYPSEVLKTIAYRDAIVNIMKDTSSEDYERRIINVQQFVSQIGVYGEKVELSPATEFRNSSISKYAWQFDLGVTSVSSKAPPHQGKAVYVLGNNGWYYFMVTAEKENWANNQAFFKKVLGSIKVDQ